MERWHQYLRRNAINLETQGYLTAVGDDGIAREFADIAIEELGFDLVPGSEGYKKLCNLINVARLAANDVTYQRRFGDVSSLLFPELGQSSRGYVGATPSRWWKIGVKDRVAADGVGGHSFRHTLADRLRSEAELLGDQIEVVLGHNQ